jgi:hypothetical protein
MQVVVREEQLSLSSRAGAGMAGLSFKAHLVRDRQLSFSRADDVLETSPRTFEGTSHLCA